MIRTVVPPAYAGGSPFDLATQRSNIPLDRVVAAVDISRKIAVRTPRFAEWNMNVNAGARHE